MIANSIFTPLRSRCLNIFMAVTLLSMGTFSVVHAQEGASLNEILFSKLPGDDVQINIITDQDLDEPGSFSTDSPARIALDFFGVKNGLADSRRAVDIGKVESILAVETADRTRLVINLYDTARYKLSPTDDGYAITVFNTQIDESAARAPKPFATRPALLPDTTVENVDFRRSEAGGGKLVVDFNDDGVTVDTRERDGEIIVDLLGATLPSSLERRLDVTDFATPVQSIDAFQNGDNVRMVVVPQGKSQHIAFQAGKRFTLVVDPIVVTEEDLRNAEDLALGYEGERLSVDFQDIEVRSALAIIADFTGINFVTSDNVQGSVTLNLKDVPWDQALDVILRTRGLSQRRNGDIIWVAPSEEIQEFEEQELRANAVVNEFAPLLTEVIQINYARAEEIAEVIESIEVVRSGAGAVGQEATTLNSESNTNSILSARGSVTVDQRTNSILVQDVADSIKALREVVSKLDKPVRQVLIETRIVEANDTFSRELGARLGFQRLTENARFPGANDSNIGDIITSGTTEGITTISDSLVEIAENDGEGAIAFDTSRGAPGGLGVDLGANGLNGNNPGSFAFDIFRSGTGFAHLITLELSALEAEGKGRVVASPRLVTANQREAMISQGQEIVESVDVLATGAGGGGGGGITETIEAELTLRVTPQITPDDRVIMDVRIEQDTIISLVPTIVLGTQEIDTQILADNGETVVIGGIYQEDTNLDVTKVPLLGDLPFIGRLFKQTSRTKNRTELLIFLTPKIISPKLNLG